MLLVRLLTLLVCICGVCACNSPSEYSSAEECYDECLAILEAKGRALFDQHSAASFPGVEGVNLDEMYRENAKQQCEAVRRICKDTESKPCVEFMEKIKSLDYQSQ
jgi:hypothetical protein